jgi:AP-1 complex subunit gamma-1
MASSNPVVPGYAADGFELTFECCPDGEVIAHFKNTLMQDITNLVLQAAVPKYLTMNMSPPSSTTIKSGDGTSVTQSIKIVNSQKGVKKVMLKLKISYSVGGNKVETTATANQFPAGF